MSLHAHDHNAMAHALSEGLAGVDPWALAGFLAVMSFGFLTSLHCAVMCGPLVCARLGPVRSAAKPGIWLYNLGRLLGYPLVGAAAGAVGGSLGASLAWWSRSLTIAVATILAVAAIAVFLGEKRITSTLRVPNAIQRPLFQLTNRLGKWSPNGQIFVLGLVTALLPCATLSPVVLLAASTGDAGAGALVLLAFALGTAPAMVTAPLVPTLMAARLPAPALRTVAAVMLLIGSAAALLRLGH